MESKIRDSEVAKGEHVLCGAVRWGGEGGLTQRKTTLSSQPALSIAFGNVSAPVPTCAGLITAVKIREHHLFSTAVGDFLCAQRREMKEHGGGRGVTHHQVEDKDEPGHVAVLRSDLAATARHFR